MLPTPTSSTVSYDEPHVAAVTEAGPGPGGSSAYTTSGEVSWGRRAGQQGMRMRGKTGHACKGH